MLRSYRTQKIKWRDKHVRNALKIAAINRGGFAWNDLSLLLLIHSELLPRAEFHSEIAGWINMTSTEFRHPRLKPVADELTLRPGELEDWAKNYLLN